jgi:hypothetical protein
MVGEAAAEVEALRERCRALCAAPPHGCPRCGSAHVVRNGTSDRTASVRIVAATVYAAELAQRRLRCAGCDLRWIRRPPELLPRVHFQPCVAASVVEALAAGGTTATALAREHGCHRRTIGRLVARVAAAGEPADIAQAITARVDEPVLPAPPEIPALARRARTPSARERLVRAVWMLALVEVLAGLRGVEPPALSWWMRDRPAVGSAIPADARGARSARDPPSRS